MRRPLILNSYRPSPQRETIARLTGFCDGEVSPELNGGGFSNGIAHRAQAVGDAPDHRLVFHSKVGQCLKLTLVRQQFEVRTDPFRLPVVAMQESHRPLGDVAPRRRLLILIPHLHFPETPLARTSGRPGTPRLGIDPKRCGRYPTDRLRFCQGFRGRGDENVVGRLAQRPGRRPPAATKAAARPHRCREDHSGVRR